MESTKSGGKGAIVGLTIVIVILIVILIIEILLYFFKTKIFKNAIAYPKACAYTMDCPTLIKNFSTKYTFQRAPYTAAAVATADSLTWTAVSNITVVANEDGNLYTMRITLNENKFLLTTDNSSTCPPGIDSWKLVPDVNIASSSPPPLVGGNTTVPVPQTSIYYRLGYLGTTHITTGGVEPPVNLLYPKFVFPATDPYLTYYDPTGTGTTYFLRIMPLVAGNPASPCGI